VDPLFGELQNGFGDLDLGVPQTFKFQVGKSMVTNPHWFWHPNMIFGKPMVLSSLFFI
jgi:hypothetical protein